MWLLPILGILLGAIFGLVPEGLIPQEFIPYVGVGIIAAFDTLIGGLKSLSKQNFSKRVFLGGFLINTIVATFITWIGNLIGIEMHLAVIVVFGTRIFQNIAELRRNLLKFDKKSDRL